jgi:hypothetical protein
MKLARSIAPGDRHPPGLGFAFAKALPLEIAKLAAPRVGQICVRRRADFLIDGGVTAISPVGARASLQRVENFKVLRESNWS